MGFSERSHFRKLNLRPGDRRGPGSVVNRVEHSAGSDLLLEPSVPVASPCGTIEACPQLVVDEEMCLQVQDPLKSWE